MFEDTSDCLEIASLESDSGLADGRAPSRNEIRLEIATTEERRLATT
jgi:hypothetical protein